MDKIIKTRGVADSNKGNVNAQVLLPLTDARIQVMDFLSDYDTPIDKLDIEVTITLKSKEE